MFKLNKPFTLVRRGVQTLAANKITVRRYSKDGNSRGRLKLAILGAGGRVGQPLALMLKNSPNIEEIALYDCVETRPLATELSHIDTRCRISSYKGRIKEALCEAKIVAIVAANSKACSDYKSRFKANAVIVFELIAMCAKYCPKALIAIATEPINSLVPLAGETLKKFRVFDPNKLFGVTTLDVMRTNVKVARILGVAPEKVHVPVIGGHSDRTIVPVLSHATPSRVFTNEELVRITEHVQCEAGDDDRKLGRLSLSAAFAVGRFCVSLARALKGGQEIVECAFVPSDQYGDLRYLATPVQLGIGGVQRNMGVPPLSDYEDCLMQNAAALLRDDIKMGESFATGKKYQKSKEKHKPDCTTEIDICNPCT